jgi:HdeA/HdeB family protein
MRLFKFLILGSAVVMAVGPAAHAQGTVDMSKFTCEQLLAGSGNSVEAAIWLSGYYNGQRKNTKLDTDQFRKNAEVIVAECKTAPKKTVMQTIKSMMSGKK